MTPEQKRAVVTSAVNAAQQNLAEPMLGLIETCHARGLKSKDVVTTLKEALQNVVAPPQRQVRS